MGIDGIRQFCISDHYVEDRDQLSTHTTRDIKHNDHAEENDSEIYSTASISSRSQSNDKAIVSMNRAYDTGDSMASSQKSNIIILITTTFITISYIFF